MESDVDSYEETFSTWNQLANLYQEKFMDLQIYDASYQLFLSTLLCKPNAAVLDIGCGPGNIARYVLTHRPDFRLLGVDIAPQMIALAQKNNPGATFRVMDSRNISQLLPTQYDGIICGFCLPYLTAEDQGTFLTNIFQLLVPGGHFYLSFVEGDPAQSGFKVGSTGLRSFFAYQTLAALTAQLLQRGFASPQVIKVEYEASKEQHTILLLQRPASSTTSLHIH